MSSQAKPILYYDGLCPLCSREINHYRKSAKADLIQFIDITSPDFEAQSEGLDPFKIHQSMHLKKANGEIVTGVDAFQEIWSTLPGYGWMAHLLEYRPVHKVAEWGYSVFAKLRPYLPRTKRQDACADSPYCETRSP